MKFSKLIVGVSLSAFVMTSCLKDKEILPGSLNLVDGIDNSKVLVNFAGNPFTAQSLAGSGATKDIAFEVVSNIKAAGDIAVSIDVDTAAVTAYNKANGTSYKKLPLDNYEFTTKSGVIKSGEKAASFKFKLKTTTLAIPYGEQFMLAFTIKDAGGNQIPSNFKSYHVGVVAANAYEGTYKATGTFNHPTAGIRAINQSNEMISIDDVTCETDFADLGGQGWKMWLKVNPDNTVTLIPKGSANTGTTQFSTNTYDPATKTYTLNYQYNGRVITQKLKYTGPL